MYEPPEMLARGDGVAGEVALRRRRTTHGDVFELIVNGTFLMDSAETSTERLLAEALLDRHAAPRTVLVGGLGLGFTVQALLADPRVERVEAVELEPLLPSWLRSGLVPGAAGLMRDPRLEIVVADVRDVLETAPPQRYDGILLDVDNGPDFLVREANAGVYRHASLQAAFHALAAGGLLAVWSAAPSDQLALALSDVAGNVDEIVRTVSRHDRDVDYHIYLAQRD